MAGLLRLDEILALPFIQCSTFQGQGDRNIHFLLLKDDYARQTVKIFNNFKKLLSLVVRDSLLV